MSGTLEYRVRIRNASTLANPDGTADDLVLSSVAGGTNPYLVEQPSGDGQELDPITGAVTSGTYRVLVADPIVSGTDRLITQKLEDANRRQQLLSRRTYIEFRENGGAWTPLFSGYVNALRLVNAITWQLDIGDTRRVERTKQLFERSSTQFAKRGCISGGPIIGGWGPVTDLGGWLVQITNVTSTYVTFKFLTGYQTPDFRTTSKLADLVDRPNGAAAAFAVFQEHWSVAGSPRYVGVFDKLVARITTPAGALAGGVGGNGLFTPLAALVGDGAALWVTGFTDFAFAVSLAGGAVAPGSVGDKFKVSVYADPVCDASPLYITGHPADVVKDCYANIGVAIDATSITNAKATLGENLRVSLRVTEAMEFDAFLRDALLGPFGLAVRVGVSGAFELITTRIKTTAVPSQTINTNDLRDADTSIFDLDESTAISQVTLETKAMSVAGYAAPGAERFAVRKDSWPLDGVWVSESSVQVQSADYTTFGQRQVTYRIPGMVHDATSFASDPGKLLSAIANELFDRYGRGAVAGEIRVLRASAITAQPGDELYLQPGHIPNANKRYADDNSVGARIMQVVKRTEAPEGPELKLLDSGTNAQPVAPAAVITIAASAAFPRRVAEFTITNAAAINATGVLQVAVEWATGVGAPAANGNVAARYDPGNCPTGAVALPSVAAGTKVWVRARTEQLGRRPSAWTAWTSVTLTAATAPSALATSNIRRNAVTLTWTNGAATDPIGVYAYEGGAPPADWGPYLMTVLPPGSTTAKVRNLNGPTITYQVAVAHIYADGSTSAKATTSFATNSTLDTAPRPAGIQVISTTTADASQRTGIALAVWASDPTCDIEIERAPDSGGSPGAFALVTTVPGSTKVWIDDLPTDGAQRWYRIRHALSGMTPSGYTCNKAGTPGNLPERLEQPDPVAPIIGESIDETAGTMTLAITDPQCRVDFVEKRTKVGSGSWSGFSTVAGPSPYVVTVSIPTNFAFYSYINMRAWGWDQFGTYGVLFDDTKSYVLIPIVEPAVVITIHSNQSSSDTTAKASAVINTPSNISQIKWLASTSAYPSQSSVASSGTTVSGGSPFAISDLGVSLAMGDTVYLTVITYEASIITGLYYNAKATRSNLSATKTALFPLSSFVRLDTPPAQDIIVLLPGGADYIKATDANGQTYNPQASSWGASFILPNGCTITQIAGDLYASEGSDTRCDCSGSLYGATIGNDIYAGGALATVTAPNTAAWSTQTASLSQSTTNKRFQLFHGFLVYPSITTAVDLRLRSYSVTYLPADLQATL